MSKGKGKKGNPLARLQGGRGERVRFVQPKDVVRLRLKERPHFSLAQPEVYFEMSRVISEQAPAVLGSILDLGCGEGDCAAVLAEHLPDCKVIGMDKTVSGAWGNFACYPNIEFREGNATKLPFEDDSFQAITLAHVLMYMDTDECIDAFAEVSRVLAPGGLVIVSLIHLEAARRQERIRPGERFVQEMSKELKLYIDGRSVRIVEPAPLCQAVRTLQIGLSHERTYDLDRLVAVKGRDPFPVKQSAIIIFKKE